MNIRLPLLAALMSLPVLAGAQTQASGQIATYHLNSAIAGRGLCLQVTNPPPDMPWACLYQSNPLYRELSTFLMSSYLTGRTITLFLDARGNESPWPISGAEGH